MQTGDGIPWPAQVPELSTARLRLRAPHPARDAAGVLRVLGDSEVTRYHSMPTLTTLAEARDALEQVVRRFTAGEMIRWAILRAGHDELIGTVGLLHIDSGHRRGELGYELARPWWGQGLAPEAAAAVVHYGFSALGLHRIEAGTLPENHASARVLEKLGFREEGTLRDYIHAKGRFRSVRWFGLLATDPPSPSPGR